MQKRPPPKRAEPQQESASPCKVSHSETARLGVESDSASFTLAEQVDSGEYNKNKVYRKGRLLQQEFAARGRVCKRRSAKVLRE